mgnify:FL=1
MAFDTSSTMDAVASHMARSGYFPGGVQVGEFTSPPDATGTRLAGAIWMMNSSIVLLFADGGTREVHTLMLRVYSDFKDPTSTGEKRLALSVNQIASNILSDSDLGATIMSVDAAGQYGTGMSMDWGQLTISDRMYRVVDITLPFIVDDASTATA